jgi:HK97 family phage major capsid protein
MSKELLEQYDAKVKEIEAFVKAKGELITTSENKKELISIQEEAIELGTALDTANRLKDLDNKLNQPVDTSIDIAVTEQTQSQADTVEAKYDKDFVAAIHTTADEGAKNVLEVGVPAKGGVLVPKTWDKRLVRVLYDRSPIRQYATNKISHTPVVITKSLGGAKVDYVDEKGEFPLTDMSFGTVEIDAHKTGGIIKASDEIIQDSQFDIASEIITEFGNAFEDADETAFLFGDGVKKPNGILPGIPANMKRKTANTGSVVADDITLLTLGVKQVVANNGMYFMNRETSITLYNMKDGDGNGLWQRSLVAGQPPTFYSKPVVILDGMDGIVTGKLPILFGSLKGYEIWDRARATLKVLREIYAPTGQVGFLVQKRFDGLLVDTQLLTALEVK